MQPNDKIYVAGHQGMVGSALVRKLKGKGYHNIVTRSRASLDLLDQAAVATFFQQERPRYVFSAAGKHGGIYANSTYRADFIYENIMMQSNIIYQCFLNEVVKLMFYACSCIYPVHCPQPMKEEYLLAGHLESTNEPFAVAKIAGIKMCESYNRQYGTDFISVIPTNIYGRNQNYEAMNSLVVPSLIRRFHEAKATGAGEIVIWGTGRPARDFLYADDLAEASIFLMERYRGNDLINIGTGKDITITELVDVIKDEVGYQGRIIYDPRKPDGVLKKLQDISKIEGLGWKYQVELEEGIHLSYEDYLSRLAE